MGSEMCIRDRLTRYFSAVDKIIKRRARLELDGRVRGFHSLDTPCLLYTSDAADERSSVDLGGRRIIKKKKNMRLGVELRARITETKNRHTMK